MLFRGKATYIFFLSIQQHWGESFLLAFSVVSDSTFSTYEFSKCYCANASKVFSDLFAGNWHAILSILIQRSIAFLSDTLPEPT